MGFIEDIKWVTQNRHSYEEKVKEIFGVEPDPNVVIGPSICIRNSIYYDLCKLSNVPQSVIDEWLDKQETSTMIHEYELIIFNPSNPQKVVENATKNGYNLSLRNEMMRCYMEEYSHLCDSILHDLPFPQPYIKFPGEQIDLNKVKERAILRAKIESRAQAVVYRVCDFEDNDKKLDWKDFAVRRMIREVKSDFLNGRYTPELLMEEYFYTLILTFLQYRLGNLLEMNEVEFLNYIRLNNPIHLTKNDWIEAQTIWTISGCE